MGAIMPEGANAVGNEVGNALGGWLAWSAAVVDAVADGGPCIATSSFASPLCPNGCDGCGACVVLLGAEVDADAPDGSVNVKVFVATSC